jgi:hypothetical protein
MALVLALTRGTVAAGATTMVIQDSTGDYNATTNASGYGSPNAARNVLALILRVKNKRYDGEDDIQNTLLSAATYDPESVTEWTLTLNEDGWQQAIVYGLNLYNVNTLLEVGELVWNASSNIIERITVRTGGGAPYTYTKVSATEEDLDNASYTTAYSTTIETYAVPGVSECVNKMIKRYFDYKTDPEKTTAEVAQARQEADESDLSLTAIVYGFEHEYMAETQKQVEVLEAACTCFTDSCPTC